MPEDINIVGAEFRASQGEPPRILYLNKDNAGSGLTGEDPAIATLMAITYQKFSKIAGKPIILLFQGNDVPKMRKLMSDAMALLKREGFKDILETAKSVQSATLTLPGKHDDVARVATALASTRMSKFKNPIFPVISTTTADNIIALVLGGDPQASRSQALRMKRPFTVYAKG